MITYGTMGHEELLREFGFEGAGGVACVRRDLAALRRNPGDRMRLQRMERWLHTVCGASSFLGLMRLVGIAHAGAEVLAGLRADSVSFRPDAGRALTELLETMDVAFRQLTRGESWDGDPAPLLLRLQSCLPDGVPSPSASSCGAFRSGARSDATSGSAGPGVNAGSGLENAPPTAPEEGAAAEGRRPGLRLIRRAICGLRALIGPQGGPQNTGGFGLEWGETPGGI